MQCRGCPHGLILDPQYAILSISTVCLRPSSKNAGVAEELRAHCEEPVPAPLAQRGHPRGGLLRRGRGGCLGQEELEQATAVPGRQGLQCKLTDNLQADPHTADRHGACEEGTGTLPEYSMMSRMR